MCLDGFQTLQIVIIPEVNDLSGNDCHRNVITRLQRLSINSTGHEHDTFSSTMPKQYPANRSGGPLRTYGAQAAVSQPLR
ncbi:hypothetical protein JZ785_20940 [Alicyclobacillus curvatus]|nr:hypothetical protein JZ785_20940 [Alicyclobacillus curvatus]